MNFRTLCFESKRYPSSVYFFASICKTSPIPIYHFNENQTLRMAKLTDDQVVEVISAINIFDKKGDGKLPVSKLIDCLRSLGLNPLQSDVSKIAKDVREYNAQDRIEVDDFLPIYEYFLKKKKPTFQELCEGLRSLNSSDNAEGGTIPAVDLRIALTSIGDKLTLEECNSILNQVMNKQKEVDIEKLVHLVMGDITDEGQHETSLYVAKAQINRQEQGTKAILKILD